MGQGWTAREVRKRCRPKAGWQAADGSQRSRKTRQQRLLAHCCQAAQRKVRGECSLAGQSSALGKPGKQLMAVSAADNTKAVEVAVPIAGRLLKGS